MDVCLLCVLCVVR